MTIINPYNFISRKIHVREPFLIQEVHLPSKINDTITYSILGKTNSEIDSFKPLSEFQAEIKASEFKRLIQKQKLAKNRSGDLRFRIKQMEETGYSGLWKEASAETKIGLSNLSSRTISTLNDCQIFRICSGNISPKALKALEKEFNLFELQRLSERDNSTIINTWLIKFMQENAPNKSLTKYIHELARK